MDRAETGETRLVAQHPQQLPADALRALTQHSGAAPVREDATVAVWHPQRPLGRDAVRALASQWHVDVNELPRTLRLRDVSVAAFDMDSTVITIECIDEIADFAGLKPQVAAITEATMRGEIRDFADSLRRRTALLHGLGTDVLQRVADERLRFSPGAPQLLAALRARGVHTLLVSGGFTYFTALVRERLGFDEAHANTLGVGADGRLDGTVGSPVVDAAAKRDALLAACARAGVAPSRAMAVGDGSNDLAMMAVAGLSVAYRAKPAVRAAADVAIDVGGLDALLALLDDGD